MKQILPYFLAFTSTLYADEAPTFTQNVAPIIFNHCTSCHRPGEAAPFPLTNYTETKKRARLIVQVTEEHYMPPWQAEPGDVAFADERRLTEEQIAILAAWQKAGMPEGPESALPEMPEFKSGWQLGEPDLVVQMTEGFTVPADGPDVYRNFVIPLQFKEDKWVKAVEFRPGSPKVVHHSLFYLDKTGEARKLDGQDGKPGFDRMGNAVRSGGSLGGWAVGGTPRFLPDGLAYKLGAGTDLILSTHFHPSGKKEIERSTIGFYFSDTPPKATFTGIQLPPAFGALSHIDIPPGEKEYVKTDSFVIPADVDAFGVSAHAHYIGKKMLLTATLPSGETKTLLKINEWDFNWQEQYMYQDFYPLPEGTRIDAQVTWDNSSDNPNNPFNPPQRIKFGKESTDEMGSITLLVKPNKTSDLFTLNRALASHRKEYATASAGKGQWLQRIKNAADSNGDGRVSLKERQEARKRWQSLRKREQ